jgi:hypothetical protein
VLGERIWNRKQKIGAQNSYRQANKMNVKHPGIAACEWEERGTRVSRETKRELLKKIWKRGHVY